MPKRVKMPDGQIVSFPDTHTDEQIGSFIDEHFPEEAAPPQDPDFAAQVQEAKQETNPITALLRGGIAGYGYNSQNLNTQRQPNPFGKPIPSMKAVYQAEREDSPTAYAMGEVVGSIFAPGNKVGVIPKVKKLGQLAKIGVLGLVGASEGAANAYNTDGDVGTSALVSGGLNMLPAGVGALSNKSGLTKKLSEFRDDRVLSSLGLLSKANANQFTRAQRTTAAAPFRDETMLLFSPAGSRVNKLEKMMTPLNEELKKNVNIMSGRMLKTGKGELPSADQFIKRLVRGQGEIGSTMKTPVIDKSGKAFYVTKPSPSLESQTAATFEKAKQDLISAAPERFNPTSNISQTDMSAPLDIKSFLTVLRNAGARTDFSPMNDAITNKYAKKVYGKLGDTLETAAKKGSPELKNIVSINKKISPMLTAKALSKDELARNEARLGGFLTIPEIALLAGTGGFGVVSGDSTIPGLGIATLLGRRFGNPLLATTMNPMLKQPADPGKVTNLLKYYTSKGKE
jgi:hypothetical protein